MSKYEKDGDHTTVVPRTRPQLADRSKKPMVSLTSDVLLVTIADIHVATFWCERPAKNSERAFVSVDATLNALSATCQSKVCDSCNGW
jgi:hypothetical protein